MHMKNNKNSYLIFEKFDNALQIFIFDNTVDISLENQKSMDLILALIDDGIIENFFIHFFNLLKNEKCKTKFSLSVLLTNNLNIKKLNYRYRSKNKPTNVLSFPSKLNFNLRKKQNLHFLGDVTLSMEKIEVESKNRNIPLTSHFLHIFLHGLLHLIGFDHINQKDALNMENVEINILKKLGINDPYREYV